MIEIGINPKIFSIGPITIGWYGVMVDIAVIVIILWLLRAVKRDTELTADTVITAAIVGIPSGVIFSRLLHVLDQWGYYSQHLNEIIGGEGLTIWGAVLGATLTIWIYSKISNFKYTHFLDVIAPAVILGQAIGRVGCTINGCCYGSPTALPWGIRYTNPESFGYFDSTSLPPGIGLHPVPVYEIIFNLTVFAILLRFRGRFKPDGSLYAIYLTFYAVWRLVIDFLRQGTPFAFGLHEAQVISIAVLLITIPFIIFRVRPVKKDIQTTEAQPTTQNFQI